jgi:hypothetical protein
LSNTNFSPRFCITDFTTIPQTDLWCVEDTGLVVQKGGVALPIRTVNATSTATVGDYTILCDASAAQLDVLFFEPETTGNILVVKKIDLQATNVVIKGATIENSSQAVLSVGGATQTFQWDGTQWRFI